MKQLLAMLMLPLFLTSCMVSGDWDGTIDGGGHGGHGGTITEIRDLSSFSHVEIVGDIDVYIQTGPRHAAYVTADPEMQDFIETNTFLGVLTIEMAGHTHGSVPKVVVTLPDLRSVSHDGDGLVAIDEDGQFPDLNLELNAGGEIRFSGTAARLKADLNGAGRIYLEGYADLLRANLRGNGEIRAENLLAGDADVVLGGAGNIFLDLDYSSVLNLALTGSGTVEWWGAPARLNYTLSGTGKIIEHRGIPKRGAGAPKVALPKAGSPDAIPSPPKVITRDSLKGSTGSGQ